MATAVLHSWRTREASGRLGPRPAWPATRMRIWLRREQLLDRLAAGEDPATDPELAGLAAELDSPRRRQALAAGYEALIRRAAQAPSPNREPCPPNRHEVRIARGELEQLVGRLRDAAPAQPHGLAIAERLLCDPSTPLHCKAPATSAWRLAREARVALDATPSGTAQGPG